MDKMTGQKKCLLILMPNGIHPTSPLGTEAMDCEENLKRLSHWFDGAGLERFKSFKNALNEKQCITNMQIPMMDGKIAYVSGYTDPYIEVIILVNEYLSDVEVLKQIILLNSQQLNEIRNLSKKINQNDDVFYNQISKLNNELLNSKRTIEKQNAELIRYNNLLKNMSIEDSLTGCYNRRYFYDYMHEKILSLQNDDIRCLIMIDFNHFKSINDQYGHDAGDRLLVQFVKIARTCLKNQGEVFRLGGDEFILVVSVDESTANQMMIKLNQQFHEESFVASVAYGIVQFRINEINHDFDLAGLLKTADELMYAQKKLSKQ